MKLAVFGVLLLFVVVHARRAPGPFSTPNANDYIPEFERKIVTRNAPLRDNAGIAQMVLSMMDLTVDPCTDFYNFSCGSWMRNNPLPPDRSRYTRSFNEIQANNEAVLKQVCEDANNTKVYNFYQSCMNKILIDSLGASPLLELLAIINEVSNLQEFSEAIAQLQSIGVPVLWGIGAIPDAKNPLLYIVSLSQGGIAMYDRSLYLDNDTQLYTQYIQHVVNMLDLAGEDPALAVPAYQVEYEIAQLMVPNDQLNNPFAVYNKINRDGLNKIAPLFQWDSYFAELGATKVTQITVDVPPFYQGFSDYLNTVPLSSLIAYLKWSTIHHFANVLSADFVQENFNFFGKILGGLKQMPPRYRTCLDATDNALGDLTGTLYAKIMFGGDNKTVVSGLLADIEDAMTDNLQSLSWMDDTTRAAALKKVSMVANLIGFPSKPDNYDNVTVSVRQYFANTVRTTRHAFQTTVVGRFEKPVDKTNWQMTADTVNAYYDPSYNEMVFPAGILQSPFFNTSFPLSMNYGAIGMVMGHELTHGFDNQGKDYDGSGTLVDWWQPQTEEQFNERATCVINQYSSFEVLPGVYVNGNLTQGENIADFGGIKNGYNAWRKKIGPNYRNPSIVPNYTDEQLFFIAYAQGWCTNQTPEYLRQQVKTDPHSPSRFRVLGPLRNFAPFSTAFSCPAGSYMNPPSKCQVW